MTVQVAAIVPAFNEADTIEATVGSLHASGCVDTVYVIDDGSSDDTAPRAQEAGACVHRLDTNRGKTEALKYGVQRAEGDVFLFVDADLGSTAGLTTQLLTPILDGTADMAIAAWPRAGSEGGFGFVRSLAEWFIRLLTGETIKNPLSGQRAIRRDVWAAWQGSYGYGFEVALTIDALRAGMRITEIPLALTHRPLGRSLPGFIHRGRQLCHIVRAVGSRCFIR